MANNLKAVNVIRFNPTVDKQSTSTGNYVLYSDYKKLVKLKNTLVNQYKKRIEDLLEEIDQLEKG